MGETAEPCLPPGRINSMTWTIDLPRGARTRYINEIRSVADALVDFDTDLKNLVPSSNCKFEFVVAGVRTLAEDACPDPDNRSAACDELIQNTNWSHHGKKQQKWQHT